MRLFLSVFLLVTGHLATAQYRLKGRVTGSTSNRPLPYATIMNLRNEVVVISDEAGAFEMDVTPTKDRLQITNMGYKPLIVSVLDAPQPLIIRMQEDPVELPEVAVNKRKLKKRTVEVGFYKDKTYDKRAGTSGLKGNLHVTLIRNQGIPNGILSVAYFQLTKNEYGPFRFSKARVRVLRVDPQTGRPGQDLLRTNEIVTINPLSASFSIDLSRYNIPFEEQGVYLGLEFFCEFVQEPTGKGHYRIRSNCPHIASTRRTDYKTVGETYYQLYERGAWRWIGITNGELSKAYVGIIYKFGARVVYYE